MPNKFDISKNEYLKYNTIGYHNTWYTGFENPDNPDFLNKLKNTFNKETLQELKTAKEQVKKILIEDLCSLMDECSPSCLCINIPRAKALNTYTNSQLLFTEAIRNAVSIINVEINHPIGIEDGTDCIVRVENTRTTHLKESTGRTTKTGQVYENDGKLPYPGITKDTCKINKNKIKGRNIILIDDIYTNNVNIDEDCIQALYDNGARNVIFYAIAYTRRN